MVSIFVLKNKNDRKALHLLIVKELDMLSMLSLLMSTGLTGKSCLAFVYLLQLSVQMLCKTLVKNSHLLLVFVRLTLLTEKCLVSVRLRQHGEKSPLVFLFSLSLQKKKDFS